MANFWDLPTPIREKIYRLHLVQEDPIDFGDFRDACGDFVARPPWPGRPARAMPRLLQLCKRTEREAAPIYFGENTFLVTDPYPVWQWKERLWPRHMKLIRQMTVNCWRTPDVYGSGYNDGFRQLGSLKGLVKLTVKVDEQRSLEKFLERHSTIKWHSSLGCSPQLQLQTLHFSGIMGLKSLTNIREVKFAPMTPPVPANHPGKSGAIAGGILDTIIRSGMQRAAHNRR